MGKHAEEYRNRDVAARLAEAIAADSRTPVRLMEVCGTHTMSIFRNGIRSLLPSAITLLSGPGCPVCVTSPAEIDAFIALAAKEVTIATFGDLMRVPGRRSSLERERSRGRDVRVVYSTLDALDLARKNPDRPVVFLGVGFETTAPTTAAALVTARAEGLSNFSVFSAHKRVIPALMALWDIKALKVNGFLLPGHVSVIIGMDAYRPLMKKRPLPCVAAGFEPADILHAIHRLIVQIETGRPALENAYPRAVTPEGNPRARSLMETVFESVDAPWRGMGVIPDSGMGIRKEFEAFDAMRGMNVPVGESPEPAGCACGQVITGLVTPPECPLFRKTCTPMTPAGPCMVSTEGTCAAYYRYHV